jgi:hypothetical protein
MNDEKFEDLVKQMSQEHNTPPETPRERMWERIDADRQAKRQIVRPRFGRSLLPGSGFTRMAAAAVAILAIGISVGKMLPQGGGGSGERAEAPTGELVVPVSGPGQGPGQGSGPEAVTAVPADARLFYNQSAASLFGRADVLLTDFRTSACAESEVELTSDWAGALLLQTRLLMGAASDCDDPADKQLLDLLLDLEMVMVQIVGLSRTDCAEDTAWIRQGLQERSTVERLRLMSANVATEKPL